MEITPHHRDLINAVRPHLLPWRKMTIAVDGFDNAGKSTLARFLAWQLGMPVIETDMMFPFGGPEPTPNTCQLNRLIQSRLSRNRPVIVEGIFVLRSLSAAGIDPDFLVRVEASGRDGSHSWEEQFNSHAKEHPRAKTPDFLFSWIPNVSGREDT